MNRLSNEQEAYNAIDGILRQTDICHVLDSAVEMVQVGDLRMARDALSLQISKQPTKVSSIGDYVYYKCPNCDCQFIDRSFIFCKNCGQKLDWHIKKDKNK